MVITKIHVSSFGALNNVDFDFKNGINTIKEDNGFGKTTLSVFIKAMFYGFNKKGRTVKTDERKQYTPWGSNSLFGGYIEFDFKGKNYRIERFFGQKESDDTIKLYDTATMTEYKGQDNLGERLFGIDEAGFVSTCFLSQNNYENSYVSIISKFEDIAKTNNANTFIDAKNILENDIKDLKQRGEKGKIPNTQREINAINLELEKKQSIEQYLITLDKKIKENEEKIKVLDKEIEFLDGKSQVVAKTDTIKYKKEDYKKLLDDKNEMLSKKDKLYNLINGQTIYDEEYQQYFDKHTEYLKNKDAIVKPQKQTSTGVMIPFFIFSFISLIVSVVGLFILPLLFYICFPLTFAFVVFGLIFVKIYNKNKKPEQILSNDYKNDLIEFLRKYGYSENELNDFLKILNNIKDVSKDLIYIKEQLKNIEIKIKDKENDADIFKEISFDVDYQSLNRELNEKRVHCNALREENATNKNNIVHYEEQLSNLKDLESKKDELEESLKEYNERFDILSKTVEFLDCANENLKVKYRKPLEDALNKYLSLIVIEKKISAKIDTDLNIFIEENGVLKEADYYSKGFQDLFRICKSFALCDVLFTNEKPFVVLDDVFTNLDDNKLKEALNSVKELSSEYQILYFVCHESRRV